MEGESINIKPRIFILGNSGLRFICNKVLLIIQITRYILANLTIILNIDQEYYSGASRVDPVQVIVDLE